MQASGATVVVIGSLNLDYLAAVERLPTPGQTIAAAGLIRRFGGKGANQAVAASRQGSKVSMIGCVGEDDDGYAYLKRLKSQSIDVSAISRTSKALTGTALIAVDRRAENMIIVAAGANGCVGKRELWAGGALIARARVVLLQFEIPMRTVLSAVRLANRAKAKVVLNPSPLRKDFPWGRCRIDSLIANAGEAQAIFGLAPESLVSKQTRWRKALADHNIGQLIITRGAQSTLCLTGSEYLEVPTLRVKPVDTVGAGDAFAGAFAARQAEGLDLASCIRLANCAGALTTRKQGAQEAIPDRAATERAARNLA
jgi:ribokinase